MIGPAAPSFHSTHEGDAPEQDSKPGKQQDIEPISAALRHPINPPKGF
jgi:hypothetical protein